MVLLIGIVSSANLTWAEAGIVQNDFAAVEKAAQRIIDLHEELVLSSEDDDNIGHVADIAVTSDGDLLLLDYGFNYVARYTSDGQFLGAFGREGQGPGDFDLPTAIAVDHSDHIYVADKHRITVFSPAGEYIKSKEHNITDALSRTLRVLDDGGLVLSCFELFDQQVLHGFDDDLHLLRSFCDSYGVGKGIDVYIEKASAGGYVDLGSDGFLYYSQINPYEIRKFSVEGELLTVIYRDNDFLVPPLVEKKGEITKFHPLAGSFGLVALSDGGLVNVAIVPDQAAPKEATTILDVFDGEGRIIATRRFKGRFTLKCSDIRGKLYGIEAGAYVRVARYSLSVRRP